MLVLAVRSFQNVNTARLAGRAMKVHIIKTDFSWVTLLGYLVMISVFIYIAISKKK